MLRGIILGTVSGLALAAVALATASLLGPQPAGNAPPAPPLTAAPDVAQPDGAKDAAAVTGMTDAAAADPAASVTAPVAEAPVDFGTPLVDTAPAAMPDIAPEVELSLPDTSAPPALSLVTEAPVLPNPLAEAPTEPEGEADLTVSTTPATPTEIVVVEVTPEQAPLATDLPSMPDELTAQDVADLLTDPALPVVRDSAAGAAVRPADTGAAAAAPDRSAPDPAVTSPDAAPVVAPDAAPVVAPDAEQVVAPDAAQVVAPDAAPMVAPNAAQVVAPDTAPDPVSELSAAAGTDAAVAPDAEGSASDVPILSVDDAAPVVPDAVPDSADAPAEPAPGAPLIVLDGPVPSLPAGTETVRINRPGAEPLPDTVSLPDSVVAPEVAAGPALVQFATAFDNPLGLPLVSVILIDAGDMAGAATAVAAIAFPVTVAIDPARPGAAEAMAAYRAQGIEVAALVRLPLGAQPVDVEVVYEAAFATLPAAVALLDIGEGGLQGESAILTQALDRLAADGRGLAMLSDGLNTTVRRATAAGVPAIQVFRDLDAEGQDARVIRRFLDQAAFRARQDGNVVMLARVRPDTLSALNLWGAADRAAQVALAPLSAILTAGVPATAP